MDNVSSIDYLPPNDREKELFKAVTPPLDYTINTDVVPIINEIEYMYDPSSEYYDPDRIISLLGSKTLINLLDPIIDKASLSIILTDLMDMKGTIEGFQVLLSLLNIKYKTILFDVQPTGCTSVTLVFNNGQRINLLDIYNLQDFAVQLFPLCLTLEGISNCSSLISPYSNAPIQLGVHYLDINFVTDQSLLDNSYGVTISTGLSVLLCNNTDTDLDASSVLTINAVVSNDTLADLKYVPEYSMFLDNTLILDYSIPSTFETFMTLESTSRTADLIYTDYYFDSKYYSNSIYVFTLDISILGGSTTVLLDTIIPTKFTTNALDFGFILDSSYLDSAVTTSVTVIFTTNATISDLNGDITSVLEYTSPYISSSSVFKLGTSVLDGSTDSLLDTSILNTYITSEPVLGYSSLSRVIGGIGLDYTLDADSGYIPALS